jgi:hypothetical protein
LILDSREIAGEFHCIEKRHTHTAFVHKEKKHDSANSQNPRLMTNAPPENKKNSTFWRCFPWHHSPMHKITVTTTVGKRQILNCDKVLKAMRGGAAIF